MVEQFLSEKESLLETFYKLAGQMEEKEGEELDQLQREEIYKLKEDLEGKTKATWFHILNREIELVNATEKVLLYRG